MQRRPFHVGEKVVLDELEVTVTGTQPDGNVSEILARFDRPLADPSYVWLAWEGGGYASFSPPPLGQGTTLPETDYFKVAYPPDSLAARITSR